MKVIDKHGYPSAEQGKDFYKYAAKVNLGKVIKAITFWLIAQLPFVIHLLLDALSK